MSHSPSTFFSRQEMWMIFIFRGRFIFFLPVDLQISYQNTFSCSLRTFHSCFKLMFIVLNPPYPFADSIYTLGHIHNNNSWCCASCRGLRMIPHRWVTDEASHSEAHRASPRGLALWSAWFGCIELDTTEMCTPQHSSHSSYLLETKMMYVVFHAVHMRFAFPCLG